MGQDHVHIYVMRGRLFQDTAEGLSETIDLLCPATDHNIIRVKSLFDGKTEPWAPVVKREESLISGGYPAEYLG